MALLPDASSPPRPPLPLQSVPPPLTAVQQEILTALEGGHGTHVRDRPASPGPVFWRAGLGASGILALGVGTVVVFFFTIFGAVLLFFGSAVCVYALQTSARAPDED